MRRAVLGWMVLIGLAVVSAPAACADQDDPTQQADQFKFIPWIEVNTSNPKDVSRAIEGLRHWRKLTDTAIVSTRPGHADIYKRFREALPSMRIIPGIKTSKCLTRFDSITGWERVAAAIRAVCEAAGERRVLLENEGALKDYWYGKVPVDLASVRKGLRKLPDDIEYIWYPSLAGESEDSQERAAALCRVVEDELKVRFTDGRVAGPRAVGYSWSKKAGTRLDALAKEPTIPILYCYGPGSRWWQDENLPSALEHVPHGWVILYPGAKRWPEAARSITTILKERKPSGGP